jgi:cysteine desulfuration protein SufE
MMSHAAENPIPAIQEALIQTFQALPDWESRYQKMMQMGKAMPLMPEALKTELNQVKGCQSTVWMHVEPQADGTLCLQADSDALIVKGLIAMLVTLYHGQKPNHILATPPEFVEALELTRHMSLQRSNGLAAMVKQIKLYAQVLLLQQQS